VPAAYLQAAVSVNRPSDRHRNQFSPVGRGRWDWIKINPTVVAKKPGQAAPEPDPPSAEEAARVLAAAWNQDDTWGTFVWITFVTGMRRVELFASLGHLRPGGRHRRDPAQLRVGEGPRRREDH
jgi:hypothetical protein